MSGIKEFFESGFINRIYQEELVKSTEEQAKRIIDKITNNVKSAASIANDIPKFYELNENFIYPKNLRQLCDCGVRVFRYKYTYTYGVAVTHKPWSVFLILDNTLADTFEKSILKPFLPKNTTKYDYTEITYIN